MKIRVFAVASAIALMAATANAGTLVSGWDFSQYFGDGLLSTDGVGFQSTLDANYSDLDPTFNAGAESAAFGTLYFDGQFASDTLPVGVGTDPFVPTAGSLSSGLNLPLEGVGNPFDSHTILANEGQTFTEFLSMTASQQVSVVFSADLTSIGAIGSNWELDLAARTFVGSGGNANIGVEVSTDGVSYASAGEIGISELDTPYNLALGELASDALYVRLTLGDQSGGQPIIDNLGISAGSVVPATPEPGLAVLMGLGLAGLAGVRRYRA